MPFLPWHGKICLHSWAGKLNIAMLFWVGFINNYKYICLVNLNYYGKVCFFKLDCLDENAKT